MIECLTVAQGILCHLLIQMRNGRSYWAVFYDAGLSSSNPFSLGHLFILLQFFLRFVDPRLWFAFTELYFHTRQRMRKTDDPRKNSERICELNRILAILRIPFSNLLTAVLTVETLELILESSQTHFLNPLAKHTAGWQLALSTDSLQLYEKMVE